MPDYSDWLSAATISPQVAQLRPDYHCVLLVAQGLTPGASNEASQALLARSEQDAVAILQGRDPASLPHIAAWREAYKAFGAKPQRFRNSAEALLRRAADGLPRINRLTDAYNAVSIRTQTPLGGENLDAYSGPLSLVRATGDENFDTLASGAEVTEHPEPGEVVWRDELGVTCRRWNWRQCYRTRLDEHTVNAVFICDVLDVEPGDALTRAADVRDELSAALTAVSPGVRLTHRLLSAAQA